MTWTRDIPETDWDAHLERHPEATIFHTRIWSRVVRRAFPQIRDVSLWRAGDDAAALPLYEWRRGRGLVRHLHSSFPFLYGGPVPWPAGGGWKAWGPAVDGAAGATLIANPFARRAAPPERVPAGWRLEEDRTHLLRLPETPEEFWESILTTQKRNDIRRLTRKGVTVELAADPAAVDRVHALYLQRVASWTERPGMVYPPAYFHAMAELGGAAVRLYVVLHEERIIGGTFIARWGDKVHYVAGYFDHEARKLRPNVVVQDRIIRDAIAGGFALYDMLPSAGLRNVEVFKESFGSQPVSFWRLERRGRLQSWARRLRKLRR
ncbi:MAG: GNAT family N-acetyltransferase [Candidatus Eisenbacteria bacterium]|nr:GNAT family N-acetyltransferase [Candidatus Eisenbacteria bacterium]